MLEAPPLAVAKDEEADLVSVVVKWVTGHLIAPLGSDVPLAEAHVLSAHPLALAKEEEEAELVSVVGKWVTGHLIAPVAEAVATKAARVAASAGAGASTVAKAATACSQRSVGGFTRTLHHQQNGRNAWTRLHTLTSSRLRRMQIGSF